MPILTESGKRICNTRLLRNDREGTVSFAGVVCPGSDSEPGRRIIYRAVRFLCSYCSSPDRKQSDRKRPLSQGATSSLLRPDSCAGYDLEFKVADN